VKGAKDAFKREEREGGLRRRSCFQKEANGAVRAGSSRPIGRPIRLLAVTRSHRLQAVEYSLRTLETASPAARHDVCTRYSHVDERPDCQDNVPACVPSTVWGTASRRNSQVGLSAVLALNSAR
jgi:hypothetical protein